MDCTACHDPHGQDSASRLEALGTVSGNRVCTKCHAALAQPSALQQHSHHPPESTGGACLNCHMPKKNMGLAYELTRYHRIGSPTDPERVLGDRPLECALCHADRSVEQIVSTLEKWWGKRYDRAKLQELYGADLRVNPVRIALVGGKPHERVLAAEIAVRRDVPGTTESMVALLDNQYPLVRYFARHSLERRLGNPLPLDMSLPGPALVQAAKAIVERSRDDAE
jgi:predicted CXXCH cytochrome family protein